MLYYIFFCSNFTNNSDPGGIVNLGFNNANFYGLNKFENNKGPSLQVSIIHHSSSFLECTLWIFKVVGSLIKIFGNMVFKSNDARGTTVGTVYISEFGQLQVTDGTTIDFSKNKAE